MTVQRPVVKVLTSDQWDGLLRQGRSAGSDDDRRDGFVHLSTPEQVGGTIARHFPDADLLILLTLDAEALGDGLRWEPSRGAEDFPHLYREILLEDVRAVRHLRTAPLPGAEAAPDPERWRDLDGVPRDTDERAMLEPLLDWYRDGVLAKVAGLTDAQARQRHLASATTIAGVVKHLALAEDTWFEQRFAGRGTPAPWDNVDWDADPDWEFTSAVDGTLDEACALYREALTRSRAAQARASLDDVAVVYAPERGPFTLRWLLLHMLEETARHLGHLDVLREVTDGATGV